MYQEQSGDEMMLRVDVSTTLCLGKCLVGLLPDSSGVWLTLPHHRQFTIGPEILSSERQCKIVCLSVYNRKVSKEVGALEINSQWLASEGAARPVQLASLAISAAVRTMNPSLSILKNILVD
jgi:hypothetical protein